MTLCMQCSYFLVVHAVERNGVAFTNGFMLVIGAMMRGMGFFAGGSLFSFGVVYGHPQLAWWTMLSLSVGLNVVIRSSKVTFRAGMP